MQNVAAVVPACPWHAYLHPPVHIGEASFLVQPRNPHPSRLQLRPTGPAHSIDVVRPHPGMVGSVAGSKHCRPPGRRGVRRCHRRMLAESAETIQRYKGRVTKPQKILVLGGTEINLKTRRETGRCFLRIVQNRRAATIERVVRSLCRKAAKSGLMSGLGMTGLMPAPITRTMR